MGCTVNSNLELKKDISLDWGLMSEDELLEKLGLRENIEWAKESNAIREFIEKDYSYVIKPWMGSGKYQRLSWCGLRKICGETRLGFRCAEVWITYYSSPKLCLYIYPDRDGNLKIFIPRRGNTINPRTDKPIGWDVGYDLDQRLWAQSYEEDYEFLVESLGEMDEEDAYEISHKGILEPDWSACYSEFLAYAKFDFGD